MNLPARAMAFTKAHSKGVRWAGLVLGAVVMWGAGHDAGVASKVPQGGESLVDTKAPVTVTAIKTVVVPDNPECPQEDSCVADYHDGQWHIVRVK